MPAHQDTALARLGVLVGHLEGHEGASNKQKDSAMVVCTQNCASATSGTIMHAERGISRAFPQASSMVAFPEPAHDALDLNGTLSPDELRVKAKVRAFMVREGP